MNDLTAEQKTKLNELLKIFLKRLEQIFNKSNEDKMNEAKSRVIKIELFDTLSLDSRSITISSDLSLDEINIAINASLNNVDLKTLFNKIDQFTGEAKNLSKKNMYDAEFLVTLIDEYLKMQKELQNAHNLLNENLQEIREMKAEYLKFRNSVKNNSDDELPPLNKESEN